MIEELHIRDLGVIAETELPLGPGFTAITGETGAGKTMVVQALGLLMGERSDAGAVRMGTERARVTGIVATDNPAVAEIVEAAGGEVTDGELVMNRVVSAEGRSRASVGGTSAPVGALAKLAEHLFAVHGQSEQLRLRSQTAQRETLDRFGGSALAKALADYADVFAKRAATEHEIRALTEARLERTREAEQLRAELEEIESVNPEGDEIDALQTRIERLSNIESLREAAATVLGLLAADSDDVYGRDATSLVAEASGVLDRVAHQDSDLAGIREGLVSAAAHLQDAVSELSSYASSLDAEGPAELENANERLAALLDLTRKYGSTIDEVLGYAQQGSLRLLELDGDDDRIEALQAALDDLVAREEALATELTALRRDAAERLSAAVTGELQALALPDAEFRVDVNETEATRFGRDAIEMLLAPHPGAPARPVAKAASGGELSRVMLALEVVVAGVSGVPTFVFDEVDAGVGGAAAIEIGRRLAKLAEYAQVIVVTHLAQVAAFANNHLQVVKDSSGGFTKSSCRQLHGDDRLAEIARLLSGMSDSESALEHAAELLALSDAPA